jgi:hypothetical protein
MLKNGKEALLVAFITGTFGALAVLLKDLNTIMALVSFVATLACVYFIIWRSMARIKESIGSPETHPVFYTIDSGLKLQFDYLPIAHAGKKALVVLYIKTKFMLIRNVMMQTIEDDKIQELPMRITCAVADTRDKMCGKAPEVFIRKMAAWDNKYNAWTMEALASIVNSTFYADKNMKYSACFDCVQVMMGSTFIAIENTIAELNGELEEYLNRRQNE